MTTSRNPKSASEGANTGGTRRESPEGREEHLPTSAVPEGPISWPGKDSLGDLFVAKQAPRRWHGIGKHNRCHIVQSHANQIQSQPIQLVRQLLHTSRQPGGRSGEKPAGTAQRHQPAPRRDLHSRDVATAIPGSHQSGLRMEQDSGPFRIKTTTSCLVQAPLLAPRFGQLKNQPRPLRPLGTAGSTLCTTSPHPTIQCCDADLGSNCVQSVGRLERDAAALPGPPPEQRLITRGCDNTPEVIAAPVGLKANQHQRPAQAKQPPCQRPPVATEMGLDSTPNPGQEAISAVRSALFAVQLNPR